MNFEKDTSKAAKPKNLNDICGVSAGVHNHRAFLRNSNCVPHTPTRCRHQCLSSELAGLNTGVFLARAHSPTNGHLFPKRIDTFPRSKTKPPLCQAAAPPLDRGSNRLTLSTFVPLSQQKNGGLFCPLAKASLRTCCPDQRRFSGHARTLDAVSSRPTIQISGAKQPSR